MEMARSKLVRGGAAVADADLSTLAVGAAGAAADGRWQEDVIIEKNTNQTNAAARETPAQRGVVMTTF
jgi:hypothetical protein